MPAEPCAAGQMALPGDPACRPVSPCEPGTWGDAPEDPSTQHVDASFAGGSSDGSAPSPWTTIQAAIDAAAPGAVVAIAAGTYAENVSIAGKAITLWGRCPELVHVVSATVGVDVAVIGIGAGADGSGVRGVSISGGMAGVYDTGSEDVLIERVWIHEPESFGIGVRGYRGAASIVVRDVLVEASPVAGIASNGARATVERVVVRGAAGSGSMRGIVAQVDPDAGVGAEVAVRASVVEQTAEDAVLAEGSAMDVDGSLVRDTVPSASASTGGRGVAAWGDELSGLTPELRVTRSVIERVHEVGILLDSGVGWVESTVVRDVRPMPLDQTRGFGVVAQVASTTMTVQGSLVERARGYGCVSFGADLLVDGTIVRGTEPEPGLALRGLGIAALMLTAGERASLLVSGSVVEKNRAVGIIAAGSDLEVRGTHVRDTLPETDDSSGIGAYVVTHPEFGDPSSAVIERSVIERSRRAGVEMRQGSLSMLSSVVRDTAPELSTGEYGGGVIVAENDAPMSRAEVSIRGSIVEGSHMIGILLEGCDAEVVETTVQNTHPQASDGLFGRAIQVQNGWQTGDAAEVTFDRCTIRDNPDFGLVIADSYVTVRRTLVERTASAAGGIYGDGMAVASKALQASLDISDSRIAESARAGVTAFGGHVSLQNVALDCNVIHLDGETLNGFDHQMKDLGGNTCGCAGEVVACSVQSSQLEPPPAL
jgi:hypothetical protein